MIAAIEWIPAGRADPTPTKYEYSRAEREFLSRMQADEGAEDEGADAELPVGKGSSAEGAEGGDASDEEWEDVEDEEGGSGNADNKGGIELPTVDPSSLPADLRMDEYSDDEDDGGKDVGNLLLGKVRRPAILLFMHADGFLSL